MQGMYSEVVTPERSMFDKRVIQFANFSQSRHEYENGTRICGINGVLKTYFFQESNDEIIRHLPLVQEVDSGGGLGRVTLFKLDVLLNSVGILVVCCSEFFGPIHAIFVLVEFVVHWRIWSGPGVERAIITEHTTPGIWRVFRD